MVRCCALRFSATGCVGLLRLLEPVQGLRIVVCRMDRLLELVQDEGREEIVYECLVGVR